MRRLKLVLLSVLVLGLLVGCGKSEKKEAPAEGNNKKQTEAKGESSTEKIKVQIANTQGEKDTQSIGMMEVKKELEATGMFEVQLFFSSALGGTDDVLEQGLQGVPVVAMSDPGRLASYVKDFGIIQMPYILENVDDLDKLVETDLYKGWEKQFEEKGVKVITANWFNGPRNFVCNNEVNTPADLAGKKIRTIGSDIFVESINAMGAIATPMEWSEVYPSIQQGALDGAEVQTPSAYPTRLYEICKYVNKTEHFNLVTVPVMGAKVFNSWPKEAQEKFVEVFKKVGTENRKIVDSTIKEYEEEMAKKGMVIREIDKTPFKQAVEPVYEKLGYSQLREEFKKAIGE